MTVRTEIDQPDWFSKAIATPTISRIVAADGCPIHYRLWPGAETPRRRGLLFVHGSAAHTHWWDHIAPYFADDHAVAALDLAGMGESGRRPRYTIEGFAGEIGTVLRHAGFLEAGRARPVVVAHSFGAFASSHLARDASAGLGGLLIVDSHLAVPAAMRIAQHSPFTAAARFYETEAAALARFRLIPPQPVPDARILDHIARHSLRRAPQGWTWKFEGTQLSEENVGSAMFLEMEGLLAGLQAPTAIIYGEKSILVTPTIARHTADCLPGTVPLVEIPDGHHHLMLDQPLALITAIRGLLATHFA